MKIGNALSLKCKLDEETKTSISYLPYTREDGWFMVELYQFTREGKTVEFDIIIEDCSTLALIEGIEFQPLENDEHKVLEDEKVDMQPPISDSDDTYWEDKFQNEYQDILKWVKDRVQWTTKKELYSVLSKGFLINNGKEWFFLDENGKRCLMLSARAALEIDTHDTWKSLPESRFGEALVMPSEEQIIFRLLSNIKTQVISRETTYACYLVYKLPGNQSRFVGPLQVMCTRNWNDFRYVYLVSPQTPVIIRGKVDQNTHNPVNRPKIKGIPQQRSDGWMEVRVFEFQKDTTMRVIPSILLTYARFKGVIMQGIELRPI